MSEDNGEAIIIPDAPEPPKSKIVFQVEEDVDGHLKLRTMTTDLGLLTYAFKIAELAMHSMIVTTEAAKRQPKVQPVVPPPGSFLQGLRGGFRSKPK